MSVAGGLPRAVERAVAHRCDALQIFAKNASQWRGRVLPPAEIREFRARVKAARIDPVVSHASYLINLATTIPALRGQSLEAIAFSPTPGGHQLVIETTGGRLALAIDRAVAWLWALEVGH